MGVAPVSRAAVFLDRDGVLLKPVIRDGRPYPPASLEEMEIFPEAPAALARLRERGFALVVVTNQPDVARGTQSARVLDRMHAALARALPLDDILTCPHDDADHCACRKPKPGLIEEAARRHALDPARSFLIGDRWRDIDAGHAAGCTCLLIDYGYRERAPSAAPAARVHALAEAVEWILKRARSGPLNGPEPASPGAPAPAVPASTKPVIENGDHP